MPPLENAADLWCAIALRISIGIIAGSLIVAAVLRVFPRIPPNARHRLWVLVLLQGLLWFHIPVPLPAVLRVAEMWDPWNAEDPTTALHSQLTCSSGAPSGASPEMTTSEAGLLFAESPERSKGPRMSPAASGGLARPGRLKPLLAGAWIIGVMSLGTTVTMRYRRFRRTVLAAAQPARHELQSHVLRLQRRCRTCGDVRVLESSACAVPALVGIIRPTIVLPTSLAGLGAREIESLLAHELAHLKRRDGLIAALSLVSCVLNFFNPLAWWARRRLSQTREQCADLWVIRSAGHSPSVYARALLTVAESLVGTRPVWLGAGQRPSDLRRRVRSILEDARLTTSRPIAWPAHALMALLVTAVAGSLASFRPSSGASAEEPASARPQANTAATADLQPHSTPAEDQPDPLPPGVVRVFGSERYRIWGWPQGHAVSPNGKTIATGFGKQVQLTDLDSGRALKVLELNSTPFSLAFSPDGNSIVVGCYGGTWEIWDIADSKNILTTQAHQRIVTSVCLTEDGKTLMSGGMDGMIKLWDAATGEMLREIAAHDPEGGVQNQGVHLALSPDDQRVVSGGPDGWIKLWSVLGGGLLQQEKAHEREMIDVAISQDGSLVATIGAFRDVKVWEYPSLRQLHSIEPAERGFLTNPHTVSLTPDGRRLAIGIGWNFGGTVELRDTTTGQLLSELPGHIEYVLDIAVTPDGKFLVSAAMDNTIKVWDLETLEEHSPAPIHKGPVRSVAFSPDGRILATAGIEHDSAVRLWEVRTGTLLRSFALESEGGEQQAYRRDWQVAFSPNGKRLAAAGTTVFVWDLASGAQILRLPGSDECSVCFSPDSQLLGIARAGIPDGQLSVRDISANREVFQASVPSSVMVKVYTVDGAELDYKAPKMVATKGLVLTSEGRLLAGDAEALRVWDITTGKELFRYDQPLPSPPPHVIRRLSTDADEHVISASVDDTGGWIVRQHDPRTGEPLSTLPLPPIAQACSRDGRFVAAADSDGKVQLYDLAARSTRHTWKLGHGYVLVRDLAFSPDGRYLATANKNGTAYLLEVPQSTR